MTTNQHGGQRPGAGRPPIPPDEKLRRRPVGLLPEQWQWLARQAKKQKGTVGPHVSSDEIIRQLIEAAMRQ